MSKMSHETRVIVSGLKLDAVLPVGASRSENGDVAINFSSGERLGVLCRHLGANFLFVRCDKPDRYASLPLSRFHAAGLLENLSPSPLRLSLVAACSVVGSLRGVGNGAPVFLYALMGGREEQLLAGFAAARAFRDWRKAHPAAPMRTLLGCTSLVKEEEEEEVWCEAELITLAHFEEAVRKEPAFLALLEAAERDKFHKQGYPNMIDVVVACQELVVLSALCFCKGEKSKKGLLPTDFMPDPAPIFEALKMFMGLVPRGKNPLLAVAAPPVPQLARALLELQFAAAVYPKTVGAVSMYRKYNRVAPSCLGVGAPAPDAALISLTTNRGTSVHAAVRAAHPRPLVLVAGSYS